MTGVNRLLSNAGRSFSARALTLPIIGIAGLLTTRLVVGHLGEIGFATYALIVGFSALLPFNDLGLGAAVTDAVSRRESIPEHELLSVVQKSTRLLVIFSAVLITLSWALAAGGAWAPILGVAQSSSVELGAGLGMTFFAISIPLSLGARILQGSNNYHLAVALQALLSLTALAIVAFAASTSKPLWFFVAGPFLGTLVVAAASAVVARQKTGLSIFSRSRVQVPSGFKPALAKIALPVAVWAIAEPVAWHADRLILSHFSSLSAVASYSIVFALFAPINSLIAASGSSLWPIFAQRRTAMTLRVRDLASTTAIFAGVGVGLAAALLVVGPYLARFMSKGQVSIPFDLYLAFGVVIIIVAAMGPVSMSLTDATGLKFQAILTVPQVLINIPLSIIFAQHLGADGPVLATAIVLSFVLLISWNYAVKRIRSANRA